MTTKRLETLKIKEGSIYNVYLLDDGEYECEEVIGRLADVIRQIRQIKQEEKEKQEEKVKKEKREYTIKLMNDIIVDRLEKRGKYTNEKLDELIAIEELKLGVNNSAFGFGGELLIIGTGKTDVRDIKKEDTKLLAFLLYSRQEYI